MLGWDRLALPFALVRRIAGRQHDFGATVTPPDRSTRKRRQRHAEEQRALAEELQHAVGPSIAVLTWRDDAWQPVSATTVAGADQS